jgi:DNA-binding LacI/PurR family transcriptional regulator
MAKKEPTSRDVARLAGVSQSTVSRSFDPVSVISDETRERVMTAAAELGYRPNVIARSLITQQTDIVGIVMENLTGSHFYSRVLEEFAHCLQEMGKQVLLLKAPPDRPVDDMLPQVLGYQVDALIIASLTPGHETIDISRRGGRPVILFNRYVTDTSASVVCCDNVEGGRVVADFLVDAGHRRIAYIAGPRNTSTNRMRESGFTDRLRQRGYGEVVREQASYTYEAGCEAARRLLVTKDPPDAVFCAADVIALGVMDTARYELGIQIPSDLSVVGFDDIACARWPAYNLTTVRQPIDEMIAATLELLVRDEEGAPAGEIRLLPVELIVRRSART